MKPVLIVRLLMLVAAIALAVSAARLGWFPPVAFCGTLPFLIVIGLMAIFAGACLLMRRACAGGTAACRCRPTASS